MQLAVLYGRLARANKKSIISRIFSSYIHIFLHIKQLHISDYLAFRNQLIAIFIPNHEPTRMTAQTWLKNEYIFHCFSCCSWRRIQFVYNVEFVVETLTELSRSLKDFWKAEQCKFFSCSAWITVGFWKKFKWSTGEEPNTRL